MPEVRTHPSAQDLALFGHGKLSEAQAAAVAAHLETCAGCRQTVAKLPADSFVAKFREAQPGASILPPTARPPETDAVPRDLPPELAQHAKFRIVRRLGKGGMGVIYLAEHLVLRKPFALKVINPAILENPDALARFHAEARAAATLDHPNIARAYDADQAGVLHFLVMEYIEGVSLAQLLEKRGTLSVASACHCVCQAALGLQHACERGMVHRDIKPQNLMLTPKGQVKVLDFGLARLRGERKEGGRLTQADSFMGTPEYVAPEQATDARSADIRADIYSLGCTLYALLTGQPPFQEETMVKLVLAHIEKEPPPLHELRSDVPVELSAVAVKMLAKDPAARYQRPLEVAQALAPFTKAGNRARPVGATPVQRAAAGTVVSGNTSRVKGLSGAASKAPARKPAATMTETPFGHLVAPGAPTTWWKRPAVLAGGALVLLVLAGLLAAGVRWWKSRDATIVREDLAQSGQTAAGSARAHSESPQSESARARAEMERSRNEARQKLLASFDATLTRLAKTEGPGHDAHLIAVVKAERARFEKRSLLPWSEPMRASMLAYWHAARAALDAVAQAYELQIDSLLKHKNKEKAEQLRAEMHELRGDEVVARWNHVYPGGAKVISLCANGKIIEDSSASWTLDEGGVLRLRWPNSEGPDGVWIDTCQVSADGKTYAGENNDRRRKAPINGTYWDDD
jgi:hypothetical protein